MPRTGVEYVKQKVPAFLQRFKEETGYKEYDIAEKRETLEKDTDLSDRSEERPQVVQLSATDLTAEEAKKHWEEEEKLKKNKDEDNPEEEEEEEVSDGKIKFRKPTKRSSTDIEFNTTKKSKTDQKKESAKIDGSKTKSKKKGIKNKTLLSFNDDDEDG